jgi:AraC family transcriptional regulator
MAGSGIDLVTLDGLHERRAFTVAGISRHFNDSNKHDIPKLWDKLFTFMPIKGAAGTGESFGVEWGIGAEGFHYMAAVEIDPKADLPADLERKDVPANRYVVFRLTLDGGPLHDQMQQAVPEIWMKRMPASGHKLSKDPDFEFYPADFAPEKKGATLEFWLPVAAA